MTRSRRPANVAGIEQRALVDEVLRRVGIDGADDLPRWGAYALGLLHDLDTMGVLDLPLVGLPDDPDLDARMTGLAAALGAHLDRLDRQPTEQQLDAREQLAARMRAAARPVIKGQPDGLARRVALLMDTLGAQIEHGGEFGGLLWRRLDQVAEDLARYAEAPTVFDEGGSLPAGTYRVIKRVVVDESGARYVDEPGGVPVAGLWSRTLALIEPLPDGALVELSAAEVLGERAEVPGSSPAAVLEWVGANPGRARSALGVEYGGPDAPREDLVEMLERVIERAGDCVAVWAPVKGERCAAADGPNMPHRCSLRVVDDSHRKRAEDHRCACGSGISAAEVPFELAELVGRTYEPGRPGELPGTLVDVRAFNPVDQPNRPVGYLLVVGPGLPTSVRHEVWSSEDLDELRTALPRRGAMVARAADYDVEPGVVLRLALFDHFGHRVAYGVTVAEDGNGLVGGRATVRTGVGS